MKRVIGVSILSAIVLLLNGPRAVVHAQPGIAGTAHACQAGGYSNMLGTDGTSLQRFANAGQCVSYGAHGGAVVPDSSAQPCLNGGYASLAPAGSSTVFSSDAACTLYIARGGTPHSSAKVTASVAYTSYGTIPLITISGSGFAPNEQVTVNTTSQSTTYVCTNSQTVMTDSSGSFTGSQFQFGFIRQPSCLPANVRASDGHGTTATTVITG